MNMVADTQGPSCSLAAIEAELVAPAIGLAGYFGDRQAHADDRRAIQFSKPCNRTYSSLLALSRGGGTMLTAAHGPADRF